MKKILFILPFFILFSCSVQKRKYQKGFYVSNASHKKHAVKNSSFEKITENENLTLKTTLLTVSQNENTDLLASVNTHPKTFLILNSNKKNKTADSLCDLITLKNGDELNVKILEITPIEIKYKKCNSPDGPLYIVKKSDAFMVKYANGSKEIFKNNKEENRYTANNSNTTQVKTTPDSAIISLVAGICGFLVGFGSIPAIILGNNALKQIRAEPNKYEGEGYAKAGKILGIVGLVLKIFILLLFLILLLA